MGIGGAVAALLAAGALLLPAAPAQALPSEGSCAHLSSMIDLALANGDLPYAWELYERYLGSGCG